jgi:hypothetical protein
MILDFHKRAFQILKYPSAPAILIYSIGQDFKIISQDMDRNVKLVKQKVAELRVGIQTALSKC